MRCRLAGQGRRGLACGLPGGAGATAHGGRRVVEVARGDETRRGGRRAGGCRRTGRDRDRATQQRAVVVGRGCLSPGAGRSRHARRAGRGIHTDAVAAAGGARGGVRLRFDADDAAHPGEFAVGVAVVFFGWGVVEDVDRGHRVGELDLHALQGPRERDRRLVPVAGALGHGAFERELERHRGIRPFEARHGLRLDALDEVGAAVAATRLLER